MTLYDFQTITHGKWILAGEHSVLRAHSALVFPIREKKLVLSYSNSSTVLSATYEGLTGQEMHLLFWSVLEQGQQLLGQSINSLKGHFHLESNIPIGIGMGASAALCVAVARWFAAQGLLTQSIYTFARELEHLFHGISSGLDIAGVAADSGSYFHQGQVIPLKPLWTPYWYLSSCGQIGITAHCISQVQTLWEKDKVKAQELDQRMQDSVVKARSSLEKTSDNPLKAFKELGEAIHQASSCFKDWGLISPNLNQHMTKLLNAGASAVKPTGSGGGGYVLSLWLEPPKDALKDLISL